MLAPSTAECDEPCELQPALAQRGDSETDVTRKCRRSCV